MMEPLKKGKKAPPVPKFTEGEGQRSNHLEQKLNNFFSEIREEQAVDSKPKQQPQKAFLASINSKLQTMLSSKNIRLSTEAKDAPIKEPNEAIKVKGVGHAPIKEKPKKRSELQVEYDINAPNSYEMGLPYYEQAFQDLARMKAKESEEPKEEEGINQYPLEEKQRLALRIMQKCGYKIGEGLGKTSQGIRTPLTIHKTTQSSCRIQPSRIPLMVSKNMAVKNAMAAFGVTATRVIVFLDIVEYRSYNQEIQRQLQSEVSNIGTVRKWLAVIVGPNCKQFRLFAEMETTQQALQVFSQINNKYYNNNLVSIRFYDQSLFQSQQLAELLHPHIVF